MAGVTNVAFRTLCRELEREKVGTVSGLYVCEMVTARALVERHPATLHMTTFAPDESPRSLQLYTVDPATTFAAARMIADEGLAETRLRAVWQDGQPPIWSYMSGPEVGAAHNLASKGLPVQVIPARFGKLIRAQAVAIADLA